MRKISKTQHVPTIGNEEALSALYAGVSAKLSMAVDAATALENKLTSIVAGALVVLTVVLNRLDNWEALSALGIYLLSASILFALAGSWPREYPSSTVKVNDFPNYLSMDNKSLLLQLISDCEKGTKRAKSINNEKIKAYYIAVSLFIFGSAFSLMSFFVSTPKI